jgi:hypothetical protein
VRAMLLPIIERMSGTFIHYKLKDDVAQIAQFLYYDTSYAVPHTSAFSSAAAWYIPFYLYFVFCAPRAQKTKYERR